MTNQLLFSQRHRLVGAIGHIHPFNIINKLDARGLLDRDAVRRFLKEQDYETETEEDHEDNPDPRHEREERPDEEEEE